MTVAAMRTELGRVLTARQQLLDTGQEYTLQGSHSVRNPLLAELDRQEQQWRRRILMAKGMCGQVS